MRTDGADCAGGGGVRGLLAGAPRGSLGHPPGRLTAAAPRTPQCNDQLYATIAGGGVVGGGASSTPAPVVAAAAAPQVVVVAAAAAEDAPEAPAAAGGAPAPPKG